MGDFENDIEKYRKGLLTEKEMHLLEKRALSDPFLADALEGAESIGSEDFSVAGFGMLLRESEHAKSYSLENVLKLAHSSKSSDKEGYRSEFINLVEAFKMTANH